MANARNARKVYLVRHFTKTNSSLNKNNMMLTKHRTKINISIHHGKRPKQFKLSETRFAVLYISLLLWLG